MSSRDRKYANYMARFVEGLKRMYKLEIAPQTPESEAEKEQLMAQLDAIEIECRAWCIATIRSEHSILSRGFNRDLDNCSTKELLLLIKADSQDIPAIDALEALERNAPVTIRESN